MERASADDLSQLENFTPYALNDVRQHENHDTEKPEPDRVLQLKRSLMSGAGSLATTGQLELTQTRRRNIRLRCSDWPTTPQEIAMIGSERISSAINRRMDWVAGKNPA
jgi:hypothetical protein